MKNDYTKILVITGLVAVVAMVGLVSVVTFNNDDEKPMGVQSMSMDRDYTNYLNTESEDYMYFSTLNGEDFDRLFISNMIAHHEGAVDMAELALQSAERQEIKDLSQEIISAQSDEITQMSAWQKDWGYPDSSGEDMVDHSAMGMMGHMEDMNKKLEGLRGEEFDKAFLSLMIEHHQSALNMAAPGVERAYHSEVKTLINDILRTQAEEIAKMRDWQKAWGHTVTDSMMYGSR